MKRLERATLTIGTMCTIGPQLISELLVQFRTQHPDVEVQIVGRGRPLRWSRCWRRATSKSPSSEFPVSFLILLHQLPIFEERFVIVLPPNHRLAACGRPSSASRTRPGTLCQSIQL